MSCPISTYPDPTAANLTCLHDGRAIWPFALLFDPDSWAELAIYSLVIVVYSSLVCVSTLLRLYIKPKSRAFKWIRPKISHDSHEKLLNWANHPISKAFDMVEKHDELVKPRGDGGSRLAWLDAFRVGAMAWVMGNHLGSEGRVDVLERDPKAQKYKDAVHVHPFVGPFFGNSALGVEIFLCLGSILSVRSFSRIDEGIVRALFLYMCRRSLRLWLTTLSFVFLAFSPQLRIVIPRFFATMCTACGWRGILAHLSFLGNYQSVPTCLGYLWYLGLDAQLHIAFIPLLVSGLLSSGESRRKASLWAIVGLVFLSIIWRAAHCLSYSTCHKSDVDIPFIHIASLTGDGMEGMYSGLWNKYGRIQTKMGPFLLAIMMGVWEKNGVTISIRKSRALFWSGLAGSIAVTYAIIIQYWDPSMPSSHPFNVGYTATFRTLFAVSLLSMISSFVLLEHPPRLHWSISCLAKLCFSAYLVHMPMAYIFNYLTPFQQVEDAMSLLFYWPFHVVLSFLVAYIYYISIEGPMNQVATLILAKTEETLKEVADNAERAVLYVWHVICQGWQILRNLLILLILILTL